MYVVVIVEGQKIETIVAELEYLTDACKVAKIFCKLYHSEIVTVTELMKKALHDIEVMNLNSTKTKKLLMFRY